MKPKQINSLNDTVGIKVDNHSFNLTFTDRMRKVAYRYHVIELENSCGLLYSHDSRRYAVTRHMFDSNRIDVFNVVKVDDIVKNLLAISLYPDKSFIPRM
jgi:hypothetical protein